MSAGSDVGWFVALFVFYLALNISIPIVQLVKDRQLVPRFMIYCNLFQENELGI